MNTIPEIPFIKAEADGNDFLLLPASAVQPACRGAITQIICDRHRGIGADGVEWWRFSPRRHELRLQLYNSDGAEAEFSGNGTRCAAAWCMEHFVANQITAITAAGRKRLCRLSVPPDEFPTHAGEIWMEMEMGVPGFDPSAIPASAPPGCALPPREWPLDAQGRVWPATVLSMGNPQCCVLVEAFPPDWPQVTAALGRHPAFPRQANVELVRVLGPHDVEIRICERGAGVTLSSGTGSCASAVTAMLAAKVRSPVRVRTQGGLQQVAWAGGNSPVILRGPARIIARGRWRHHS